MNLIRKKAFLLPAFLLTMVLSAGSLSFAQEAGFAGSQVCAGCHEAYSRDFTSNIHGKVGVSGAFAQCESCHGPGAEHVATSDKTKIIGPTTARAAGMAAMCLGCHSGTAHLRYWKGSTHQSRGVDCTGCHMVHGGGKSACGPKLLKGKTEMDTCLCCHADVKMSLSQRSRHPMRDSSRPGFQGNMTCSDCHNVHGTVGDSLIDANSVNDKCYECHLEKKAPVLWEHSPVKENCLVCHTPHGSNQQALLSKQVHRLCQSCHFQGRHQTIAGAGNHVWSTSRGCVNCHPMIHGSNNPSAVKLNK